MRDRFTARTVCRKGAHISVCGNYRYALWRIWDDNLPSMAFIGLNPSTADRYRDDPTIRRMVCFARDLGYGSITVVNLFALRSKDPSVLIGGKDPVGPHNDAHILGECTESDLVIACWSAWPSAKDRALSVIWMLTRRDGGVKLHVLGLNKDGHPRHPLYLKRDAKPVPWDGYADA